MNVPKPVLLVCGIALGALGIYQIVDGLGACRADRHMSWSATRATSLVLGDFTVKIPNGWRDASESKDPQLQALLARQPGAKVLVKQDFDGQIAVIQLAPGKPVGASPACAPYADALAKKDGVVPSDVAAHTFEGDPGCRWIERKGSYAMQLNLRFHGAELFFVSCSGSDGGICPDVLDGVTVAK